MGVPLVIIHLCLGFFHCKTEVPPRKTPNLSPPSPGQCICPPLASTPSLDLETVLAAPGKAARSGKFECAMWVYCIHQHIWHIYQHIYQHIDQRIYVHMYMCIYICTHTYTHTHIHTYIHACMHPSIHPYIHIYIYIYIYQPC